MSERSESDLLGTRAIPANVYWGVHTLRAQENFPITGIPIGRYHGLIVALATVKQAAAEANAEIGVLDRRRADAIVAACEELRRGHLHDQFVVDAVQGGAGTSTNMNANEVIANRALELLGYGRGAYDVLHPNDHVNLSQSTNDVYQTAVKLALIAVAADLGDALSMLAEAFDAKASEFADVVKIGRTQLQDAVPMTLGQELHAFATTLREDVERLSESTSLLHEINLGGTAIGTGINARREYGASARSHLAQITGLRFIAAPDLVEATQDAGVFVHLSSALKRIAVKLSKICNDLRLLSSGPQAGLGEINLPAMQAGSSMMPGKVNPVIPEVVNQIAFEVIGADLTVTMAAEAGQLQLNAFEPVMFRALYESVLKLQAGVLTLRERCVVGIDANRELLERRVGNSIAVAAALNPYIGYKSATAVALQALESRRGISELVLEQGLLSAAQLAEILSPLGLSGSSPDRPELITRTNASTVTPADVPAGPPGAKVDEGMTATP